MSHSLQQSGVLTRIIAFTRQMEMCRKEASDEKAFEVRAISPFQGKA